MLTKGSLRLVVGLCLALAAGSVFANGYEYMPGGRYRPSNETLGRIDTALFGGTCYYIGTQTPIDCRLDFKVLGLADVYDKPPYNSPTGWSPILIAGGHTPDHTDLAHHPLFYDESPYVTYTNGAITANLTDATNPTLTIPHTGSKEGTFTYKVPEVAGLIAVEVDATFSDPYFCAGFCYDFYTNKTLYTMDVGYYDLGFADTDLIKLQVQGDDYLIKLVNPSVGHDDPTAGASKEEQSLGDYMSTDAVYQFLYLAQLYHGDADSRLSVNDASLPVGGLYDYEDQIHPWDTPHAGHRDGLAIDINTTDEAGNTLDCHIDRVLKAEARELMHQKNHPEWTAYVCEEGTSHIHINFFNPAL